VTEPAPTSSVWDQVSTRWLTVRRLRAQAVVLAICLWGGFAGDFATPGFFDRAGNIKFQDFLPIYISARLVAQHRAADLYNTSTQQAEIRSMIHEPTRVEVPYLYGPQVGLLFQPLAKLPFSVAAPLWATLSLLVYFACCYAIGKRCPNLRPHSPLVVLAAVAFPPLFHFFVRGQMSALVLACFTVAFVAMRANRSWLAGIALGLLAFKPQFLVAIPLIFLLARAWSILAGLLLSSAAQLAFARIWFGPEVMSAYISMLRRMPAWIDIAEVPLASIQMHSLRSFWNLLIPAPQAAFALYALSSVAVIWITVIIWKSPSPLSLRFAALIFAAVLVNPHIFVYDLLVLAPALILIVDWTLASDQHPFVPRLQLFSYLAYILPLFGPLARWTHLQLSIIAFVGILAVFWRMPLSQLRTRS